MLHRFSLIVASATVVLIVAGGLVTSTGSGLAVPDWPTTYGEPMFAFPLSKMVGGIFYEHGHRLIASTVGMLTIVLAGWLWSVETRGWLRRLGWVALTAVITQGVLGGLTVLFLLPAPISIAHAGLAQLFFCLTVTIALATSPGWRRGFVQLGDEGLVRLATTATVVIYAQILVGATMRHTGAGLAIPDFPLVFGGVVPPAWDRGVAVHYAHRIGALAAGALVIATFARVWRRHRARPELVGPAIAAVVLLAVQIALGGATVLTRKAVPVNTAHVITGALLLAASLVLTLRAWHALETARRMREKAAA